MLIQLDVDLAFGRVVCIEGVRVFKGNLKPVGYRYQKYVRQKRHDEDYGGADKVWPQKAVKAGPAGEDRYNLRLIGHFGGKVNYSQKIDQWRKEVEVKGHKSCVILKYDLVE
jgi:hypothetical protein